MALAWPWVWTRFGGPSTDGGTELIAATLLVIAVPAHALVVGWGRSAAAAPAGTVDVALLQRIGAWLAAAAGVTGLRALAGV